MPAIAAAAVLTVVVFAGFSGGDGASTGAPPGTNPGQVTGITAPTNTGPGVVVGTDSSIPKTTLTRTLTKGMSGPEVQAMQQRLKDFGFDPGPIDGQFGTGTQQALWAFEGLVMKRKYDQQTGKLTDADWQTMQDPLEFKPRRPQPAGATHMEIYLDLQAAIVFTDNKPTLITHISSGTGEEWCSIVKKDTDEFGQPIDPPEIDDECGISKTPGGVFKFYRRVAGDRQGPLGGMYNPVYFNYGIAVHGAINVPNKPASHGCIRIPMFISEYFPNLVKNKDLVYVWDGKKEPEDQSTKDMLPVFNYKNPNSTLTSTSSSTTSTTTTTIKPTTTTAKPKPPATTTTKPATTTTSTTVSGGAPVTSAPKK